ncbi:MAG: cytochrome c biogenesis CcdA family protein [bacterium]
MQRIKIGLFILFFLFGIFSMVFFPGGKALCTEDTPVQLLYFYSEECEDCHYVEEFILEPLKELYPINVNRISVDDKEGYERLIFMEEIIGDTENQIPVIILENKVMGGIEEIESNLEQTIIDFMEAAREEKYNDTQAPYDTETPPTPYYPPKSTSKEKPSAPRPIPNKSPEQPKPYSDNNQKAKDTHKVYAAYFSKQGCKQCNRAYRDLEYLQSKYSNLTVRIYDIADQESKILSEALGKLCGVPENKRLTTPSICIGKDFLLEENITLEKMEELILKYSLEYSPPPWEMAEGVKKEAGQTIISRFKGLNITTIMVAGLLDGINPCAFATIIFFISYLAYIGRKGKEILMVGAAFTLAVFVTYVLVGLGFLSFIKSLSFLPLLSKIVYLGTAIFALVLGVFSLRDYFICRKGNVGDMALQLPDFLKKRIHKTIRKESNVKKFILGALVTGFIISILELACTGQVYLPTIIFVSRISKFKLRSMVYLLIYNLMFIFPLMTIFVTAYKGTSSQQLTAMLQRSSAPIKLGMAILFFALAGILIITFI